MLPPKVKDSSDMLLLLVPVGEGLGAGAVVPPSLGEPTGWCLLGARVLQGVAQPPGAQSSALIVSPSCSRAHAAQPRCPAHQAPSGSS